MHQTKHIEKRMNQRGISHQMLDLAFAYGTPIREKYVLGRKEVAARLAELRQEEKALLKIMDKGGLVVVEDDNTLITTYNLSRRPR
jgi:hypothetical protein